MSQLVFRGLVDLQEPHKLTKGEAKLKAFNLAMYEALVYRVQFERDGSFTYTYDETTAWLSCILVWEGGL
jgi:hypothetical protein